MELKGSRSGGKIYLYGLKDIDLKEIPAFFYMEVDLSKIRRRNKGE